MSSLWPCPDCGAPGPQPASEEPGAEGNRRDTNRDARRRSQDRDEHDRIVRQREIISQGWPYPGQRDRINRIVVGALRDCLTCHGSTVEGSWLGSAAKRIMSNLYGEGFRRAALTPPVPESTEVGGSVSPKPSGKIGGDQSESPDLGRIVKPGPSFRLRCMWCGKTVSTPVPHDTIVRASLECPECIESRAVPESEPVAWEVYCVESGGTQPHKWTVVLKIEGSIFSPHLETPELPKERADGIRDRLVSFLRTADAAFTHPPVEREPVEGEPFVEPHLLELSDGSVMAFPHKPEKKPVAVTTPAEDPK